MRGMFSAGVIDVMMENGITFDGAIGVSAGAAFGCNYKSHQIGRVLRYNTKFCRHKKYCGLAVWLKTGNMYNRDFCFGEVPLKHELFDFDTYEKDPMEFYVVCTDVETGEAVYHKYEGKDDHVFEWLRASAAMPIVSEIVEIDGQKLLDGGVSDSIPIKYFESIGYTKNVAILTQEKHFRKKGFPMAPLLKLIYRKYPNFIKTATERHKDYNETLDYIAEKEKSGDLFVIRPECPLGVKMVERDPEKLTNAYNLGRATAEKHLESLKEFLKN